MSGDPGDDDVDTGESAGGTLHDLLALLDDPRASSHDRAGAASDLGRRGRRDAWPRLQGALQDRDPMVRACAADALAAISGRDAAGLLIDRLSVETVPNVRRTLVSGLGAAPSSRVVDVLARTLDDEHEHSAVRSTAAEALGQIALTRRRSALAAVPALARALNARNSWIRHDSLIALGYMRAVQTLSAVIALADADPDRKVRRAALNAVGWMDQVPREGAQKVRPASTWSGELSRGPGVVTRRTQR